MSSATSPEEVQRRVEKEAAEQALLQELRSRTQEVDICRRCLDDYQESPGRMCARCDLTIDVQLREKAPLIDLLPADQQLAIRTLQDPVAWARTYLSDPDDSTRPWVPRWYQLGLLRCSSKLAIARLGRQTGKTASVAVRIVHRGFTRKNYKMVLITPQQSQIDEIFERVRVFIDSSPLLPSCNDLPKNTLSPQIIRFPDGAQIRGFPAGSAAAHSIGKTLRGQSPHDIIIDEGGLLPDDLYFAVFPFLHAHPDTTCFIAGTPMLWDSFYELSEKPERGFKTFHVESNQSPTWTQEIEDVYRNLYPKAVYDREFRAVLTEADSGVYLRRHIDASLQDYRLEDEVPLPGWDYGIGVDWNGRGIGTLITVIGLSPDRQFRVVKQKTVDPADFTQHAGITAVHRLAMTWKPISIYVDYGYGATNAEALRKAGLTPVEVNMGTHVEIQDPVTGQKIKKQAKEFMVDLSARQLEGNRCILPKSEDHTEGNFGLVGQMRNYQVTGYSDTGRRKFTQDHDHAIVSWALAIMGIIMEHPDSELGLHGSMVSGIATAGLGSPFRDAPPSKIPESQAMDGASHRPGRKPPDKPPVREDMSGRRDFPVADIETSILHQVRRRDHPLRRSQAPPRRKLW
jgi:hypothetical protein